MATITGTLTITEGNDTLTATAIRSPRPSGFGSGLDPSRVDRSQRARMTLAGQAAHRSRFSTMSPTYNARASLDRAIAQKDIVRLNSAQDAQILRSGDRQTGQASADSVQVYSEPSVTLRLEESELSVNYEVTDYGYYNN